MQPDIHTAFQKIDNHAGRIFALESTLNIHDFRLSAVEKASNDQCVQLKITEQRIVDSLNDYNVKLDSLIAEKNRQEGAKSAVKWVPSIIQVIVGLTIILAFINKH